MTLAATNYDRSHDRHMSADEAASQRERSLWLRRTSWGAILAGAVSAIGLQALFTVLGAAIGVSSFGQGADAQDVGMFAGIWWVISGIISLMVGGMIVGRMITIPRNAELVVHGFTMWAVTAVFGFLFLWSSAGMAGDVGAQSMDNAAVPQQVDGAMVVDAALQSGSSETMNQNMPAVETVRESASAASWWTLAALLLGVGAALAGTFVGSMPLGPNDHDKAH